MDIFASQPESLFRRVHPSARVAVAVGLAATISFLERPVALAAALGLGVVLVLLSRRPLRGELRRTVLLNAVFLLLAVSLGVAHPGETVVVLGPLQLSRQGLLHGAVIVARANAIVWAVGVVLRSLEPAELGFALDRLRAPPALSHLLLFLVRYVETIHQEYHRLRDAMDMRGFQPVTTLHTLRSFGNLFGLLLVHSLERSERVLAAMKCRGFQGRFYLLHACGWGRVDAVFTSAAVTVVLALIGLEASR